jgi:hypothetical protein
MKSETDEVGEVDRWLTHLAETDAQLPMLMAPRAGTARRANLSGLSRTPGGALRPVLLAPDGAWWRSGCWGGGADPRGRWPRRRLHPLGADRMTAAVLNEEVNHGSKRERHCQDHQ